MGAEITAARKGETGLGTYGTDPLLATLPQVNSITPYEKKLDAYGRPVAVQSTPSPVVKPPVVAPPTLRPPMTPFEGRVNAIQQQEAAVPNLRPYEQPVARQAGGSVIDDLQRQIDARRKPRYSVDISPYATY